MSYCLSVYLIPTEAVYVFGCKNFVLCNNVIEFMSDRFDELDDMLDPDDDEGLSHQEALCEIFDGTISRPAYAGVYGWAYEVYCSSMGDHLINNPFSPCRFEFYEQLDQLLNSRSIPLRFDQLINDCPIPIPKPDDWPCSGHWTNAVITNARTSLRNLRGTIDDVSVANAINIVQEWFALCEARADSMIVGFHG